MLNRSKILPLLLVLVFVFLVLPIYNVAAQVQKPSLIIEFGNWGGQEGEWANIEGKTAYCPPDLQAKGMECLSIPWIGQYVSALYQYSVGIAAILAMVMIMVGGFLWLTSAGSPDRVGKAKEFITSAIMGLALALFSFVILYTINPRLVNLGGVELVSTTEREAWKEREKLGVYADCKHENAYFFNVSSQTLPADCSNYNFMNNINL